MKKWNVALSVMVFAALGTLAVAAQSVVPVQMKTQVDTKAAKVGDKVMVVTTADVKAGGKVVLPKGSKLTGEVQAVTASAARNSPAVLSIAFTQAVTPKGETVNLSGGIASVASADTSGAEYGGSAFQVAISPAVGGGTQLTDAEGNFKLENGRPIQVSLSTVGSTTLSAADKK